MRAMVSLLLSEGHQHARQYPLAMVGVEAKIVTQRVNNRLISESTLMQACIGSILGGKEGGKLYKSIIKDLNSG